MHALANKKINLGVVYYVAMVFVQETNEKYSNYPLPPISKKYEFQLLPLLFVSLSHEVSVTKALV